MVTWELKLYIGLITMSPELTTKLIEQYPDQFKNLKYLECDNGWYEILSRLFSIVHNRLDHKKRLNEPLESFCWSQIKEKFGGLRVYCHGADDFINGAIDMAESVSCITCEVTGEKGKVRYKKFDENGKPTTAWVKTLCDNEAIKQGYVV
jgi:hypothetical protein